MARTKLLNGEVVALTAEEEAARDAEEAQAVIEQVAENAAKEEAIAARQSARDKLKALGLDESEVAAIIGGSA